MTGTPVRVAAFLVLLGTDAVSQVSPAPNNQSPESYRVSVDVNLLVLNATVRDRQGRFVSDLRQQDFEVYEDGVLQNIQLFRYEDVPVTVGLVIDHSGSMHPRLAHVITAAQSFVKFSNPEDQMFVVNFNEKVSMGLPDAVRFSNDSTALGSAILRFPVTGQTALYDAIVKALERLREGRHDKKVLIVISDGGDNASVHNLAQVTGLAGRSTAIIYTVGLFAPEDQDQNPAVLRRLAEATGGEAFFPHELSEVVGICERIARDIRNQYTIGYAPANPAHTDAYRAIRVAAHRTGGRLFVRTRAGYIAEGESPAGKKQTSK
jgi:Ca-activated chloride channel family protein